MSKVYFHYYCYPHPVICRWWATGFSRCFQGKAMADVVNKVFGCNDLRHLSSTSLINCHYAVVFGGVCGTLGLSLDTTLASFMSGVIRTSVASAVRLDKLGPVEVSKSCNCNPSSVQTDRLGLVKVSRHCDFVILIPFLCWSKWLGPVKVSQNCHFDPSSVWTDRFKLVEVSQNRHFDTSLVRIVILIPVLCGLTDWNW